MFGHVDDIVEDVAIGGVFGSWIEVKISGDTIAMVGIVVKAAKVGSQGSGADVRVSETGFDTLRPGRSHVDNLKQEGFIELAIVTPGRTNAGHGDAFDDTEGFINGIHRDPDNRLGKVIGVHVI
ncbi:MAG: hypothetical protein Q8S18_01430 [Bacteroidales bacterium]|nr:hypothetical protein [Bacteroidales bacterium]